MLDGSDFIRSGNQRVEKSNNSTFVFISHIGSYGDGGESFPDDGFTDIGGNEERNTGPETISLLQHFIEQNDNISSES